MIVKKRKFLSNMGTLTVRLKLNKLKAKVKLKNKNNNKKQYIKHYIRQKCGECCIKNVISV